MHCSSPAETDVDEERFLSVLSDAVGALEAGAIPYVVMGGVSSASLGRPRGTNDIDLFVRPERALGALAALNGAGFLTDETDPRWLYKGFKRDVLVDVIFRSSGDIYLDEEMLSRSQTTDFRGRRVRLIAPEDLVVIKALAADEHVPHHWHDALGIIASAELDWEYLTSRARRNGGRRVLSLLLYAQSNDLGVPVGPVRALFDALFAS